MKRWTGIAALALASCGGAGKDDSGGNRGNGSAAAPAKESNEATPGRGGAVPRLLAGQWEITVEFTGIDIPNMPADMPKRPALPPRTMRICVSEEEAGRNGPGAILGGVNTQAGRAGCSAAADPVPSERIRSTVQCNLPGGGAMRVDSEGRFTATTIEVEQQTQTMLPGATLTAATRLTGRRVGDCPR